MPRHDDSTVRLLDPESTRESDAGRHADAGGRRGRPSFRRVQDTGPGSSNTKEWMRGKTDQEINEYAQAALNDTLIRTDTLCTFVYAERAKGRDFDDIWDEALQRGMVPDVKSNPAVSQGREQGEDDRGVQSIPHIGNIDQQLPDNHAQPKGSEEQMKVTRIQDSRQQPQRQGRFSAAMAKQRSAGANQ